MLEAPGKFSGSISTTHKKKSWQFNDRNGMFSRLQNSIHTTAVSTGSIFDLFTLRASTLSLWFLLCAASSTLIGTFAARLLANKTSSMASCSMISVTTLSGEGMSVINLPGAPLDCILCQFFNAQFFYLWGFIDGGKFAICGSYCVPAQRRGSTLAYLWPVLQRHR